MLLNRDISIMKPNIQNKKIEAKTTFVIGINFESETHFARAFNYRGANIPRSHSNSAIMKLDLKYLKHGYLISKKNMKSNINNIKIVKIKL